MALKLFKSNTFVPVWEGNDKLPQEEQIRVNYQSLTVNDMFAVQRETKTNLFSPQAITPEDSTSMEKNWELMKFVLERYTTHWQGIQCDGVSVTDPKAVIAIMSAACLTMLSEVYAHILSTSNLTETEAKNSGAGYAPASMASSSTVSPASAMGASGNATAVEGT